MSLFDFLGDVAPDVIDNPEQTTYHQGVTDVGEDPDVKQNLAETSRDNFSRGHNSGFACGVMIAVLRHLAENLNKGGDYEKKVKTLQSLLVRIEQFAAKCKSVRVADEMLGPQFIEMDDDDDDDDDESNQQQEPITVPTVVSLADEFISLSDSHDLQSITPADALKFLVDMVDYQNAVVRAEAEEPIHAAMSVIVSQRNEAAQKRDRKHPQRRRGGASSSENWLDW